MAIVSLAQLKSYFNRLDKPTEPQYVDLIDTLGGGANGDGNVLSASLPLTAAQIKTLNSVPVQIVAAPGAGKAIEFIRGSINFTAGVAFTSHELKLTIQTAAAEQTNLSNLWNGASIFLQLNIVNVSSTNMVANQPLRALANADSAVGNGTGTIYILYRIITI